jgi:hypothetical protein
MPLLQGTDVPKRGRFVKHRAIAVERHESESLLKLVSEARRQCAERRFCSMLAGVNTGNRNSFWENLNFSRIPTACWYGK